MKSGKGGSNRDNMRLNGPFCILQLLLSAISIYGNVGIAASTKMQPEQDNYRQTSPDCQLGDHGWMTECHQLGYLRHAHSATSADILKGLHKSNPHHRLIFSGKGGSNRDNMRLNGPFCILQVRADIPCYRSDDRFLLLLPFPQRVCNLFISVKVLLARLLLVAGDIEENPGPTDELTNILQKLQDGQSTILSKLDDIEKRQTKMETLMSDVGTRLESLETRVEKLEHADQHAAQFQNKVQMQSENAEALAKKIDELENHSRRMNLVFYGLEDSNPHESWETSENTIRNFCREKLQVTIGPIQRAHRIGSHSLNRNRPIIANFLSYKDTEKVLSNGRKLKNTNYGISRDFSPRVREIRRNLWSFAKPRKNNGKDKVSLVHDKLIINGEAYTWDNDAQTVAKINKK